MEVEFERYVALAVGLGYSRLEWERREALTRTAAVQSHGSRTLRGSCLVSQGQGINNNGRLLTSVLLSLHTFITHHATATMSVKFEQKETIRANIGKEDLAHEVGNAITRGGGPNGYLAVRSIPATNTTNTLSVLGSDYTTDVPSSSSNQPSSHKDDHIGLACWSPRTSRIMDRQRPQQAWSLLHVARAKNGRLRCSHQRSTRSRLDLNPPAHVRWPHEFDRQITADRR